MYKKKDSHGIYLLFSVYRTIWAGFDIYSWCNVKVMKQQNQILRVQLFAH